MPFETNVFINCPFDNEYLPILRPVLFTVTDLGLEPRIATETLDSGAARFERLKQLVEESKYGIHDLSRVSATQPGEYYRLNMPFELGLDIGCRAYKGGRWNEKRCLILGAEPYKYQAAISDLAGSDIAVHRNEPNLAAKEVRDWLNSQCRLRAPGPSAIWGRFLDFMANNYSMLKGRGYSDADIENLPVSELMAEISDWVRSNPRP